MTNTVVQPLWLAERCVCTRVCKHSCDVKMFLSVRGNTASANLKMVLSWKLEKFTIFTSILRLLKLGKQHPTSLQDKYLSSWKDLSWLPDGPIMPPSGFPALAILYWRSFFRHDSWILTLLLLFISFCIFVDLNFILVHKKATKNLTKSQLPWPHASYSKHVFMVKSLHLSVTVALSSIEPPAGYSNKKLNNNNKNSKCVVDFPLSRARFLFSLFPVS